MSGSIMKTWLEGELKSTAIFIKSDRFLKIQLVWYYNIALGIFHLKMGRGGWTSFFSYRGMYESGKCIFCMGGLESSVFLVSGVSNMSFFGMRVFIILTYMIWGVKFWPFLVWAGQFWKFFGMGSQTKGDFDQILAIVVSLHPPSSFLNGIAFQ